MIVVKLREKLDKAWLGAALVLSIMPIIGLITGTAFSMGIYGMNYQEANIFDNSVRYWYVIKLELIIVGYMIVMAKIEFPLFNQCYKNILLFKERQKTLAYLILYLIIPIVVVGFCLYLLFIFDL